MPVTLSSARRAALGVVGVACVVALLEALARLGVVSSAYVPPPSILAVRVVELAGNRAFLLNVGSTLGAWATAIGLAGLVAIPCGILLGSVQGLYRWASTLIELLRPIPSVALLPVAILLFGLGAQMKIALAAYAVFWPLLINTMYGVRNVDRVLRNTARSFGWGGGRIMVRVTLPSSAPYIATGLRVAAAVALVVVLTCEILAADSGLGSVIRLYQQSARREYVYAGILVTGLLGLVVNLGFSSVERRLLYWTPGQRRG